MKSIDFKITSFGYVIASIKEDNDFNYVNYKNLLEEIFLLASKIEDISIMNDCITFKTGNTNVNISNYSNNKDAALDMIINKAIEEKKKLRKEYLKKQKIKRRKTFICTIILVAGISCASLVAFSNKNEENINENIIQSEEVIKNDNIEYKKLNNNNKNSNITEEPINIEQENIYDSNEIEIEFEDRTDTEKYKITKAYYENIIRTISNEYGIAPEIMLAIATQESGMHTYNSNAPAIGLMQLEKIIWDNNSVTAYNYKKGHYETINITVERLKDLEFNIRIACMYFQNCLNNSNYNLDVAIQMYNYGYGNIENTFKIYNNSNIDLQNALKNYDKEWLNYRKYINEGDSEYLEHVLSYIENKEDIECLKNNEIVKYSIKQKNTKTMI